jgi:UDP-3-O-[3-hydroxymyristoyl] N-acetylglucosamine deacetylase
MQSLGQDSEGSRRSRKTHIVNRVGYRYQRTIARPVELMGVGFLTGAAVRLRFQPAPPSTGVVFVRSDLRSHTQIPAYIDQVTGTARRTTLGHAPAEVALVEHVLATLAGMRIDNCYVELNAPEPPGLDGSAQQFVDLVRRAGTRLQLAQRTIWATEAPLIVAHKGACLTLHPAQDHTLQITYILDYGSRSPIDLQRATQVITPENFANEIASCRTFILDSEAEELRRQGLGSRTTLADLLVFGPKGPIDNRLRFANEPARHKILDLVGDLSLFGFDIAGHVVAYRSGHPLNIEMVRALTRQLNGNARPQTIPRLAA